MKKAILMVCVAALAFLGTYRIARSHCEIPCGIYNDKLRIIMILEDATTIEKSMTEIARLSKETQTPPNVNQVVRWVTNKEDHANKIQEVATQYFMTQRIKPAPETDVSAFRKYIVQLSAMHGILVAAMKCKQTTDAANVEEIRKLADQFSRAYFTAEDLEHLREHGVK